MTTAPLTLDHSFSWGWKVGVLMVTQLQDAAAALPLLRRAAAVDPDDADVLYYLAYAHGRTGNREEAKRVLRKARCPVPFLEPRVLRFMRVLDIPEYGLADTCFIALPQVVVLDSANQDARTILRAMGG